MAHQPAQLHQHTHMWCQQVCLQVGWDDSTPARQDGQWTCKACFGSCGALSPSSASIQRSRVNHCLGMTHWIGWLREPSLADRGWEVGSEQIWSQNMGSHTNPPADDHAQPSNKAGNQSLGRSPRLSKTHNGPRNKLCAEKEPRHTCNGVAHKRDNVLLTGQWQIPPAPQHPHRDSQPAGQSAEASVGEQLALAQMVHWHKVCSHTHTHTALP